MRVLLLSHNFLFQSNPSFLLPLWILYDLIHSTPLHSTHLDHDHPLTSASSLSSNDPQTTLTSTSHSPSLSSTIYHLDLLFAVDQQLTIKPTTTTMIIRSTTGRGRRVWERKRNRRRGGDGDVPEDRRARSQALCPCWHSLSHPQQVLRDSGMLYRCRALRAPTLYRKQNKQPAKQACNLAKQKKRKRKEKCEAKRASNEEKENEEGREVRKKKRKRREGKGREEKGRC